MKKRNYYLLMLILCIAGLAACLLLALFCPQSVLWAKPIIALLCFAYVLAVFYYKSKYEKAVLQEKEEWKRKHKRKAFPENSFYYGIRRSV